MSGAGHPVQRHSSAPHVSRHKDFLVFQGQDLDTFQHLPKRQNFDMIFGPLRLVRRWPNGVAQAVADQSSFLTSYGR